MGQTIIDEIWNNKILTGEEKATKPEIVTFINSDKAMKMLKKHFDNNGNIALHCDVDVDGIGTGYIMGRFILNRTNRHPLYIINKDKVHGIQQKHVDYFENQPLDLLIIVDSSSNEIDIVKQFHCDVLIIDHHEVGHSEYAGKTNDGHDWILVNNTLDNNNTDEIKCWIESINPNAAQKIKPFIGDDRMSCGLVVYELLRLYSETFDLGPVLENLMLYQWAGVTLFTDSIILNTERNQWYIENTVMASEIESTLKTMLSELNKFKLNLDKTAINYTIAPVINKAIRAGHSGDALNIVIYNPSRIGEIVHYKDMQDRAIEAGIIDVKIGDSYILNDMTNKNIHKNYNGVIASRLVGENNKNCVTYHVEDGIATGSFRGRTSSVDYRKALEDYSNDITAQGHKAAFGFSCPVDKLEGAMANLVNAESETTDNYKLTAGILNTKTPGKYQITDMNEFKRDGGLWKLGIGNAKLSSDEQILINVSSSDAVLAEQRGKLYIYNILGLSCKAFEPIEKPVVGIYAEFTKQIDLYIK